MKSYFRIVTILLLMMHISFGYAEETKKVYSYDWKRHEELIDKQFEEFAQQVLQIERQKVESLLTKDRANKYMEYFEKGMRSEGGLIMMEGEESRWLEIAYYSGYQQKVLFRQGYFAGLVKAAEFSEVFIAQPLQLTIKSDKQVYKAREKITVEIKLTNVGDKEFYLNTWIFDHPQAIEAIIIGPEGVVDKTIFIDYDYKMNEKDDFMLLPRRGSYVNKLH
ncbi:MAG: hypothetical protein MUO85_01505, partial [candidate division Zixibacteria bacterium]|nr:hypothetical protein [candidate division Zixibacteria bacterium]